LRPVRDGPVPAGGGPHRRRQRVAGVHPEHRTAAGAGAAGGVRDPDRERAEDLRPGRRDPARQRDTGSQRDRRRDVAGLLRRRQRPGAGVRAGHPAAHPGAALDDPEHPPVPPGAAAMTGSRVVGFFSHGLVHLVLIVVALFWLVPSLGLLLLSLRSSGDNAASGWWMVFARPAQLTLENYRHLLANPTITGSLWNTIVIAVPATVAVVGIGSMAGYAFAWLTFPGRDWLLVA